MLGGLWQYDYLTEVELSLDGSLKVSEIFAGYCETRWYASALNPWEAALSEVARGGLAAADSVCLPQFGV